MDTVIVGSGPSSLFLSFVLSGNVPYYDWSQFGPHPDRRLHGLLRAYEYNADNNHVKHNNLGLLDAVHDQPLLTYVRSSFTSFFSESVLPLNLLYDTLIASDEGQFRNFSTKQSRIRWVRRPELAVPHLVLGASRRPGGQWASESEIDDPEELTLSFAEMLSLPGLSFDQFYSETQAQAMPDFFRPPRHLVASYYAHYVQAQRLTKNIINQALVVCVERTSDQCWPFKPKSNFTVTYHHKGRVLNVSCKHLVLASGVFEKPAESLPSVRALAQPPDLQDMVDRLNCGRRMSASFQVTCGLSTPPRSEPSDAPDTVLVVGSGVSAAEVIREHLLAAKPVRILHLYKWSCSRNACPLRRYPHELYPEYASIYRLMKSAARSKGVDNGMYSGVPNGVIQSADECGNVTVATSNGSPLLHALVSAIYVRTGRSSCLGYLGPSVIESLPSDLNSSTLLDVTKTTLQDSHGQALLNPAPRVYAIGSLMGDGVVRFLFGTSLWAAQRILT